MSTPQPNVNESPRAKVSVSRNPLDSRKPCSFISIVTDRHTDALLVPRVAVVSERGERKVFVAQGDIASQRSVKVGFEDDEHAEILSGIDDGELVVIQGQRALRDGQPVNVLDPIDLAGTDEGDTGPSEASARRAG